MTYVIAEAGSCGDGLLDRMLCLIDDAKAVGANAVKFQWTSNANMMATKRGTALENGYADVYSQYLQWPIEWHKVFARVCSDIGIDYLCTVYLDEDVSVVAPYVAHFKVSSFEATDCNFIQAHKEFVNYKSGHRRRILISTGMCTEWELELVSRSCIKPAGLEAHVRFLQCTSSYPAPIDQLNLSAVRSAGPNWEMRGFSDHSLPSLTQTGALAVAAGAEYIEAHLRHSVTESDNPDRDHAMTKEQFLDYVDQIRGAEIAIGVARKEPQRCEKIMEQYRVKS